MDKELEGLLTEARREAGLNDLEILLREAKREAYQARKEKAKAKELFPKVKVVRQADQEWTAGQTLCLIHRDSAGNETALGMFTEYHRNGGRWLRPTHETLSPDHIEIVTGSWWLNPQIREIPVDTPSEVRAIRARFEMLIREFVEENQLPELDLNAKIEDPQFDDDDGDDDDWEDEDADDEDTDEDEEDEDDA